MKVVWTAEQIAGIAPSNHLLKTGRSFAQAEKWLSLHQNGDAAWGIFPLGKDKPPVRTGIVVANLQMMCSCSSRSFPCAHSLGLLHLILERPSTFTPSTAPEWLTQWQQAVQKRTELQQRRDTAVPPPQQQQKNQDTIQAGLAELELWLHDLVRNGLASARHKPKTYWFGMADRIVDAKMPGIAAELRQLAAIPTDSADWAEAILRRVSRLYLLIQGFHQFDALAPELQADLLTAVGWQNRGTTLVAESKIQDRWHILGQETEPSGRRLIQSTWLWGERSNRAAQIVHVAHGQRNQDFSLLTGTAVDARLQFYESTTPIRAKMMERFGCDQPKKSIVGYASNQAAAAAFNQALRANPWLNRFPMLVTAVPHHTGEQWSVQDESGVNLLLPTHYKQCWHLLALSGGRPLPIFGLFDGRVLTPLSVWSDGRYLPLHILRGVA